MPNSKNTLYLCQTLKILYQVEIVNKMLWKNPYPVNHAGLKEVIVMLLQTKVEKNHCIKCITILSNKVRYIQPIIITN